MESWDKIKSELEAIKVEIKEEKERKREIKERRKEERIVNIITSILEKGVTIKIKIGD